MAGAAETLVMGVAVSMAWFVTSWSATTFRVQERTTTWLVLTVMLLGFVLSVSITELPV